jgi:hypothetical protein
VQPTTLESTKITASRERSRGFSERDLWELWLLDKAEEVPCGSILTFLYYLCSKGTKHCEILDVSTLATGSVDIKLRGPVADDERNHVLRYRLTRGNVGRLGKAEKDLLVGGLMNHCSPIQGNKANPKVLKALATVRLWLRKSTREKEFGLRASGQSLGFSTVMRKEVI